MAGDPTLIKAAFQEATSRTRVNVPNLKPLYDSTSNIARQGLNMVVGAIDELKKEQDILDKGKKRQTEALQKDADGVFKAIYTLKETLPEKIVMAIKNEVKSLQEDFELVNTYGEGDTAENNDARIRITAQLERIKNEATNVRKNLMLMTQDAGNWDVDHINENDIDPLKSILQGELRDMDQNDNISVKFVKGKLTFFTENYSTGVRRVPLTDPASQFIYADSDNLMEEEYQYGDIRSFNTDEMLKMIPRKSDGYITGTIEQLNTSRILGENDAVQGTYNYDDQMAMDQANGYTSRVKTKEEFWNAAREQRSIREDGRGGIVIPALKKSLMERVDIPLHVMNNIFIDENGDTIEIGEKLFGMLNLVDDEVLDEKDYEKHKSLSGRDKETFKAAYKELIDVYTNIRNPAFNLDNSLVLLGQHHEAYSKQHYDESFEKKGGKIPGKVYESEQQAIPGNYKLGGDGELYNPATNSRQWVGYKYNKAGNIMFNDLAMLKDIQNHQETVDAFGNTYKPTTIKEKATSMGDSGKEIKGYILTDDLGKPINWIDGLEIGRNYNGKLFYTLKEVKLIGVGKRTIEKSKI
jgi:hypothetical protein